MSELGDQEEAARGRLLAALRDNSPLDEPYHEKDCPACDLADNIIGDLAAYWDPNQTWWETPAFREFQAGQDGDTVAQQGVRIVAHVLHRRLAGEPRAVVRLTARQPHRTNVDPDA